MISCVPVNDERQHEITVTCWCEPRVEWLDPDTGLPWASGKGPMVVHRSADCREVCEDLTGGEPLSEDKKWQLIED